MSNTAGVHAVNCAKSAIGGNVGKMGKTLKAGATEPGETGATEPGETGATEPEGTAGGARALLARIVYHLLSDIASVASHENPSDDDVAMARASYTLLGFAVQTFGKSTMVVHDDASAFRQIVGIARDSRIKVSYTVLPGGLRMLSGGNPVRFETNDETAKREAREQKSRERQAALRAAEAAKAGGE